MAHADEQPAYALRSLHSEEVGFVRFVNLTQRTARPWWIDFNARPQNYDDIAPGGTLHMCTYRTCNCWSVTNCTAPRASDNTAASLMKQNYGVLIAGIHENNAHPWVFRDANTGDKLLINNDEIYFPTSALYDGNKPVYLPIYITLPVYSLKDCCLQCIRKHVKLEDYIKLEIPQSLQTDLKNSPHLLREIKNLSTRYRNS